ncbi:cytochrome b5 [Leptinotarsa decemlineata]|uniref:cytochrome b5 n=1 Tax=Leptinotarsa decemlineata TaxID=7539 RepID=UPI000C2539D9|nr:cytochrome b5-like [Leptinotarsa decemlineata]
MPAVFSFQSNCNTQTIVHNQNAIEKEQLFTSTHRDRIITLEELSLHDHPKDCWIAINDRIYDITDFLDEHPAGAEIILEYAGCDATTAFKGSGHSSLALGALETFLIGQLPTEQRIYKNRDSRGSTNC